MPSSDVLGFTPALPRGSSTAKIFHSIGEEFGYEVLFPTTIGLVAPAEVNLEEWRLQACKALQEIGEEVYRSDFTSSTFMSEVIIDGKCLAVDVAGSLLKWWQTNGQEGTVVYIDYPLNPLSIDGQRWTKSLQRAVEDYHRGRWYVHGYGPLLSSQCGEIREFFPYFGCCNGLRGPSHFHLLHTICFMELAGPPLPVLDVSCSLVFCPPSSFLKGYTTLCLP